MNKRRDKSDCTPFISLFLSFRITAAAIQMPGLCASPTFVLFRWSPWEAIVDRIWKKVGAFFCNTSTKTVQLNSANKDCGIFRYTEDLDWRWHDWLHSASIWATKCLNSNSRKLSWPNMLLAIDGRCPPARALPIFVSGGGSTVVHGIVLLGVVTVTYTIPNT